MESLYVLWCSAICVIAVFGSTMNDIQRDETEVTSFDVKPGAGKQEYTKQWGTFECAFTYKAQGGTKEEWSLSIFRNKGQTDFLCVVERPGGHSYLFFEEFKLQIKGAHLQQTLLERGPGVPLKNSEFMVVTENNYVQQWDGKFDSQLSKVQIFATKNTAGKEL